MKTSLLKHYSKNVLLCIGIVLLVTIGIFGVPPEGDKTLYEFHFIANLVINPICAVLLSSGHTYLLSRQKIRTRSAIVRNSILYALLLALIITILVYFFTVGLVIYFIPGALVYGGVIGWIESKK
jgi:membrane protein insertase Oxa1/YidC/SpoIIIJ